MHRILSTTLLALIAMSGLFADTVKAGLLPAESMVKSTVGEMSCSNRSDGKRLWDSLPAGRLLCQQMDALDFSDSGMQTTQSNSSSSVSPCTLSDCVEVRLVSLTTYHICESRAFFVVPFLDGIFRPPKTA